MSTAAAFPMTVHTIVENRIHLTTDELDRLLSEVFGFKGQLLALDPVGKEIADVRYRFRSKDATEAFIEPKTAPPARPPVARKRAGRRK